MFENKKNYKLKLKLQAQRLTMLTPTLDFQPLWNFIFEINFQIVITFSEGAFIQMLKA